MKDLLNLFNRKDTISIYACKTELGYTRRIYKFKKGVRFSKLENWIKEHKNNDILFIFEDDTNEMFFN
jgi:predicted patatin/cPLA2 family phospholipase